ncbi:MAG: hypothetical protein IPL79_06170 [Myxococcales bacterium]|nr:hypothetical protein [Myxococcales bacterium]
MAISGVPDREVLASILALPGVVGVTGYGAGGDVVLGQAQVELDPGVFSSARDFAQAGREANEAMRAAVLRAAGPGEGRPLLELYAGAGNFSLPLTNAGWRVVANDLVRPGAALKGVDFVAQDAVECVEALVAQGRTFGTVVLDPPRAGALAVVEQLHALGAAKVIYVSCDVMTLARDAAVLLGSGFTLPQVVAIDAMPQTSHFEVVATFARSEG